MAFRPSYSDLPDQEWGLGLLLLGRPSDDSIVQTGLGSSAKLHMNPSGLYMKDVMHAFFYIVILTKGI